MDYERYISSAEWRSLRLKVLERDQHCCQTCLSPDDLEVHHKTYVRLGNEELQDLITLCSECHEAITSVIRRRRYEKRSIEVQSVERITPIRLGQGLENAEIEVSTHVRITPTFAQRSDSRSLESFLKGDEENQRKEREDRRRF